MADDDDNQKERPSLDESRDVEAALEKLKRGDPRRVTEIMAMMQSIGPVPNPLHQKLNERHITQLLELAAKHDEREYQLQDSEGKREDKDNQATRRYGFAAFVIIVLLVCIVLYVFEDRPNVLIPILTGIGGLIGGGLGGFGLAKARSDQ